MPKGTPFASSTCMLVSARCHSTMNWSWCSVMSPRCEANAMFSGARLLTIQFVWAVKVAARRRIVDVMLRVGNRHEREVGTGDGLAAAEVRHGQRIGIAVGDRHVERRRRRDAGRVVGRRIQDRRIGRMVDGRERHARHPGERAAQHAVVAVAAAVGDSRPGAAGSLVEAPASEQARRRQDLSGHAVLDLLQRARAAPDPDLVHDAVEEALRLPLADVRR